MWQLYGNKDPPLSAFCGALYSKFYALCARILRLLEHHGDNHPLQREYLPLGHEYIMRTIHERSFEVNLNNKEF